MTGDPDEPVPPDGTEARARTRLRAVTGPVADDAEPPPVRLLREFKGLTVADLSRDEIVRRLPGQVRSALAHIEQGDLAAAERALPGRFATVLAGPGHRRRRRRGRLAAVGVAAAAVVVAAALFALLRVWLGA